MFKSRTLFIVGAGASSEFGLPTGGELKNKISDAINVRFEDGFKQNKGDHLITEALRQHTSDPLTGRRGDINPFLEAGWVIRDAMPQALSIDNFMDAHRDDEKIALMGKLGIVRCILQAERRSSIYSDDRENRRINFDALTNTWLSAFFQLSTETVTKSNAQCAFENVSFITFNYDRCIEHFLFHALLNYYRLDEISAQTIVQAIPIIHPYGQVGCLPWLPGSQKIAFGGHSRDRGEELLAVSSQIKTFTEQIEDQSALTAMRRCVKEAETIVFLGFAYHPTNLALIAPKGGGSAKRIFATAKGISDSDTSAVVADLPRWLGIDPRTVEIQVRNKLSCAQLFGEFWRSMPRSITSK